MGLKVALASLAVLASVAACTAAPGRAVLPPPSAGCGLARVDRTLDPAAMRHGMAEAVGALRLGPRVTVLRAQPMSGSMSTAAKVGLPSGPRRLWLIYTLEPKSTVTGAANVSATSDESLLRVVDDETLREVGATRCPS